MSSAFCLTTIRFSHYNEKARWALDRFGVAYEERPFMPVLHFLPAMVASRGKGTRDGQSTRFSTPVLRTDRGEVICDSARIVRYVSDRFSLPETSLYPPECGAEDESRFNEVLAPATRCITYFHSLPHRKIAFQLADRNVGKAQAVLFKALLPVGRKILRKKLGINPRRASQSRELILRELDEVGRRLNDGRRYLAGDRFTAADLSFACALAPVLLVTVAEGFGGYLPALQDVSPELSVEVGGFRDSTAGRFALRLFREERGKRRLPCRPLLA